MTTRWAVLLALILFCCVQAAGQSVGLGPQIGIYKSQDGDNARMMGGAALRLKLSDALGIEGSVNYRDEAYSNGMVDVKSWPIMVTGLIYPIPIAYGAVGAGWYNSTISYNRPSGLLRGPISYDSETKQVFGWHFGGGVELPVGSMAKIVGDIRYVFLNYDFKNVPGSAGVNSDFYVITAGLLFGL